VPVRTVEEAMGIWCTDTSTKVTTYRISILYSDEAQWLVSSWEHRLTILNIGFNYVYDYNFSDKLTAIILLQINSSNNNHGSVI